MVKYANFIFVTKLLFLIPGGPNIKLKFLLNEFFND